VAKIPVGTPVDTGQALFTDFMLLQRMITNSLDTYLSVPYTLKSRDDCLGPDITNFRTDPDVGQKRLQRHVLSVKFKNL
jgi:hypothetical protein